MENQKEIINWVASVEDTASKVYAAAAAAFEDDSELAGLLRHLSDEERTHHELVLRAGDALSGREDGLVVSLDPETRQRVEKPFQELSSGLESGTLSREELLGHIITIEFSEFNDIFLYFMDVLRERSPEEFSSVAREMNGHKDHIREFLSGRPGLDALLERALRLPRVARERILLVEDNEMNLKLLGAVLAGEGIIETATNGRDALKAIESGPPFAAVVSDVDLPGMNGIELYLKAVEVSPCYKSRFVFITASADPESVRFIMGRDLKLLRKPAPINVIRLRVREIVNSGKG
ncbi:MAG: response regulator [Thermodesulfobacteriota bacterium]|nr:MAG: response regulator [Thermodesulfobacteriota bacterium]